MASAAEQLASNISLASFSKATELKRRLWFTLGALILFRLLSFVPIPGIDPHAMASLYQTQSGGVLDFFNTFSGGALERMSVVALGVMPYITASIVVQLGATLYPAWAALKKEGETGRKKLNQYTRYLTVVLTMVQGYFHRRRAREHRCPAGHCRGRRAGHAVPRRRDHQPCRRHFVPDVDR
jgi:preprotein translocase subunit SecY